MGKQGVAVEHRNEVVLVGRLAAPAESRELPSGDVMATFRLVVTRPVAPARPRGPSVDTIDCTAWRAEARRSCAGWQPGDTVEVTGTLRRRFWRSSGGAASRTEVEVLRGRRVARA